MAVGVAIGLGIAGLIGGGATAAPVQQQTVTVDMLEGPNRFEPRDITIAPGTTVTWVDVSGTHTTTSATGIWDSGERRLEVGESYSFTFQQPGVYDYYCRPHRNAGMVGRVIVSTAGKGMSDTTPREALEPGPAQQVAVE
jgi:plastocyanin